MENHSSVTGWQELFSLTNPLIFGRKFTGYSTLICSSSSCEQNFPKANYFRVYKKLITGRTFATTDYQSLWKRLRIYVSAYLRLRIYPPTPFKEIIVRP